VTADGREVSGLSEGSNDFTCANTLVGDTPGHGCVHDHEQGGPESKCRGNVALAALFDAGISDVGSSPRTRRVVSEEYPRRHVRLRTGLVLQDRACSPTFLCTLSAIQLSDEYTQVCDKLEPG